MPETNAVSPVRPIAGRNAIQTVLFVVELGNQLEDEVFERVCSAHPRVQNFLPRRVEVMGQRFVFGPGASPTPPVPQQVLDSVQFQQFKADGTEAWVFTASRGYLSVQCSDYSRWRTVWKTASDLFSQFLPLCPDNVPVTAMSLQYIDQFVIDPSCTNFQASMLFREQSNYLPPRVFGLSEFWHAHHGCFENAGVEDWKTLLNLNVDYTNLPSGERGFMIASLHRSLPNQQCLLGQLRDGAMLDAIINSSHIRNKEVISGLLNSEVCRMIGLLEGDQ